MQMLALLAAAAFHFLPPGCVGEAYIIGNSHFYWEKPQVIDATLSHNVCVFRNDIHGRAGHPAPLTIKISRGANVIFEDNSINCAGSPQYPMEGWPDRLAYCSSERGKFHWSVNQRGSVIDIK